MFRLISICLLLLLTACQSAVVSIGAIDLPVPVLVGPVLTLGGKPTPPPVALSAFSGGAEAVAVEPVRPSGNEPVNRNITDRLGSRDNLPQQLWNAYDNRPGRALYVERIRVIDAIHWTALFWLDKRLLAEGYAFTAATAGPGGGKP
jgi:hypothetical protein